MSDPENMRWTSSPESRSCSRCSSKIPASDPIVMYDKEVSWSADSLRTGEERFCESCGIEHFDMPPAPIMPQPKGLIPEATKEYEESEDDFQSPFAYTGHGKDPSELIDFLRGKGDEDDPEGN